MNNMRNSRLRYNRKVEKNITYGGLNGSNIPHYFFVCCVDNCKRRVTDGCRWYLGTIDTHLSLQYNLYYTYIGRRFL